MLHFVRIYLEVAAFLWVSVILIQLTYRRIRRAKFCKVNNCYSWGPSYPHYKLLYGLDLLWEDIWNIVGYRFVNAVRGRFARYGTTHFARVLNKKIVNTIDPENLETVMKTKFDDYTIINGRKNLMRTVIGLGIFGTTGDEWHRSRSLIRFSMKKVDLDPKVYERYTQKMIAAIKSESLAREDHAVDFGKIAFDWSISVASHLIFGSHDELAKQPGLALQDFTKDFALLESMAKTLTVFISTIPYLAQIMFGRLLDRTQTKVFRFVNICSKKALGSPITLKSYDGKRTLLEGLATQITDLYRIRSESLNMLLAGHDTVGIALSEMFWCLARNPHVYARLREEVSVLKGKEITMYDLKKIKYLRYVLNEAIRVRPTLGVHGRIAVRDTVLPRGGGPDGSHPLLVEKGTYIVYSNYTLYRNPKVFGADVDAFRPERWAEINPARYEYLNFGAGPRACPGKEMGWTMLAWATARLAMEIEHLAPPEHDKPWEEARAFSFHNRHGVHINMIPSMSVECAT